MVIVSIHIEFMSGMERDISVEIGMCQQLA